MGYDGWRGPSLSEFIAKLNEIPSAPEMASQGQGNLNLDDDQPLFTSTDFFDFVDFDLGQDTDLQPANFDLNCESRFAPVAGDVDTQGLDFNQAPEGDFAFIDFSSFPPQDLFTAEGLPAGDLNHTSQSMYATSSNSPPHSSLVSPKSGEKRKSDAVIEITYTPDFEDALSVVAKEEKRRRNTAASARFRVKKKHRQDALGKSVREMREKLSALVDQIDQLQAENQSLKNLIKAKE